MTLSNTIQSLMHKETLKFPSAYSPWTPVSKWGRKPCLFVDPLILNKSKNRVYIINKTGSGHLHKLYQSVRGVRGKMLKNELRSTISGVQLNCRKPYSFLQNPRGCQEVWTDEQNLKGWTWVFLACLQSLCWIFSLLSSLISFIYSAYL